MFLLELLFLIYIRISCVFWRNLFSLQIFLFPEHIRSLPQVLQLHLYWKHHIYQYKSNWRNYHTEQICSGKGKMDRDWKIQRWTGMHWNTHNKLKGIKNSLIMNALTYTIFLSFHSCYLFYIFAEAEAVQSFLGILGFV